MADAMDRTEARSAALPFEAGDTLQFKRERATFDRAYFPNGLRRQPVLVFTSESFEIHAHGDSAKLVSPEGDAILRIGGLDDRGAIVLSEK